MRNFTDRNMLEIKEKLRMQWDQSIRNNVQLNGVKEENKTWEATEEKIRKFLYECLYRASTPCVNKRKFQLFQ